MELDVDGADVVRVLLQFFVENGLHSSFAALQEESQVSLNAVESVAAFAQDIRNGRWDAVLQVAATLALPREKLLVLYEQLVVELVERRETDVARQVLRTAEPLAALQADAPEKYKQLELFIAKPYFDVREAYPDGSSRDGRRAALAQLLCGEVVEAPPSRLLALIGQAAKWQRLHGLLPQGGRLDLFRDAAPTRAREEEMRPTRLLRELSFGKRSHPDVAVFSPDGLWLVTGSSDGFIEVRQPESGRVSKQLAYQAEDALMMHDDAILAADFSADAELLATGCQVCAARARACTPARAPLMDEDHTPLIGTA
jgi:WD40 repeat-containing protein SMU1